MDDLPYTTQKQHNATAVSAKNTKCEMIINALQSTTNDVKGCWNLVFPSVGVGGGWLGP